MKSMVVRQIPDETMARIKERAQRNNRSAEAEVRSILEEVTAEVVSESIEKKERQESLQNPDPNNWVYQMWRALDGEHVDDASELAPERTDCGRPVDLG